MYRILVSGLVFDRGESGIGDYLVKVTDALSESNRVDIVMLEEDVEDFPLRKNNLSFIKISNRHGGKIISNLWHLFMLPGRIDLQKYDFMFLPVANRRSCYDYPIFTIGTVHDLSQFFITTSHEKLRLFYLTKVLPTFLRRLNSLCTVSQTVRRQLIDVLKINEDKIFVDHYGFDKSVFIKTAADLTYLKKRFSINGDYILCVSRIEHPRKNHLNLIKAYEILPVDLKNKFQLVFAGGKGPGSGVVERYINKASLSHKIRMTGYVEKNELAMLYKSASIHVFPSYYEGFGLPVLESMACGTPNVCSDIPALDEISKEAALKFKPNDPADISRKIVQLLMDNELYDQLVERGFECCEDYSWEVHASKIIAQYEQYLYQTVGGLAI